jgi:hypothetical protein
MFTSTAYADVMDPDGIEPPKTDYSAIGFDLMNKELDNVNKNLIKTLGNPNKKSKPQIWGADGLEHQTLNYNSHGISLDMVTENKKQSVKSITVTSPSKFKTLNGIKIGSTNKDILRVYKDALNPEESDLAKLNSNNTSKYSVTAGSCYGGIIIVLKNNLVTKIFIGAAAE